jgi:hypothetical protein
MRSYDYPAHNALRAAWMRYLPPVLTESDDQVFYLAGMENLELKGYLRKGLTPERLLTAEHTKSRLAQVRRNAGGVHVVDGNVMDAVGYLTQTRRPRLRAAWLDFDGNPHTFVEELLSIAQVLPGPCGGALGITGFAARDKGALKQGTINTSKFYSGLPNTGLFLRQYGRMMGQYDHLLRHIERGESTALSHFQREMGLLWWLVLMFGVTHLPQGESYYKLDRDWIARADKVLGEIRCDVERLLGTQARETDLVFVLNSTLRDLLKDRCVEVWITNIERYAFWSVNRQPMRSWFVKVQPWPHDEPRPSMQELLDQVWTLACSSPLVYIDEAGEIVTIG